MNDALISHATGTIDAPNPFPGQMPFNADLWVRPFIIDTLSVYAKVGTAVHIDAPWYLKVARGVADLIGIDVFAALRRLNRSDMAFLFTVKAEKVPDTESLGGRIEGRRIVLQPDLVGIYGEARIYSNSSGPSMDLTPRLQPSIHIRRGFCN